MVKLLRAPWNDGQFRETNHRELFDLPIHVFHAVELPVSELFLDEPTFDLDRLLEADALLVPGRVPLLIRDRTYPEPSRPPSASDATLEAMSGQQTEEGVECAEDGDQPLVGGRVAQMRQWRALGYIGTVVMIYDAYVNWLRLRLATDRCDVLTRVRSSSARGRSPQGDSLRQPSFGGA